MGSNPIRSIPIFQFQTIIDTPSDLNNKLDGKDVDPIFADTVDDRPIANYMQWIAYATWT